VATPIGNLGDLSERARAVLGQAPLVAAEDTRTARRLFAAMGKRPPRLLSVRAANERAGAARLADLVEECGSAAYVSDAGTPGVSDPGTLLVGVMDERGVRVEPVPGPCAAAVSAGVSGMCAEGFVFAGFLPRKGAARKRAIEELASSPRPAVLHESPARIAATLADLAARFGADARACLCRELTKMHEQICRGELGSLRAMLDSGEIPAKGEFTLVVCAPPGRGGGAAADAARLLALLEGELPASRAAALAARHYGIPKSDLYGRAVGREK